MKQIKTKLRDVATLENLVSAEARASKGHGRRRDILRFEDNLYYNLYVIQWALLTGHYHPSNYRKFEVTDPKRRIVLALPYCDRIVQQFYVEEIIKPYFLPRFIDDTYSCLPGRGIHAATSRLQRMMRSMRQRYGHYYVCKMDVSKFFYNIDKDILCRYLTRRMVDPDLQNLTRCIIYDGHIKKQIKRDIREYNNSYVGNSDAGVPIGNYTSQYFANIYLSQLDSFCKFDLRIKKYVRYMDDFIMLAPNKEIACEWSRTVRDFLWNKLRLKLNPKSCYYPANRGADFAGLIIHEDYMKLRDRSKRRINKIIHDYDSGLYSDEEFAAHVAAWNGHAMHADSYRYRAKKLGDYYEILDFDKLFRSPW